MIRYPTPMPDHLEPDITTPLDYWLIEGLAVVRGISYDDAAEVFYDLYGCPLSECDPSRLDPHDIVTVAGVAHVIYRR